MPAAERSLRVTDAYRAALLGQRERVVVIARRLWTTIDSDQIDVTFARMLDTLALTTETAQRHAVGLTDAYVVAFLASELGPATPPPPASEADRYAGVARDGRPLAKVLLPALATIKMARSGGLGESDALRAGLARTVRTLSLETLAAPRGALADVLRADDRIVGYRRVTSANACGACLAAATGAIHDSDVTLDVHGHCRCSHEPVVRGARDRFRRPTGREIFDAKTPEEQDALFTGRGGAEKAELIRSGAVAFDALITRSPMATVDDAITETPLQALTSR